MSEEVEKLPRGLKVFIWRKRSRGFLVVLAKNEGDAREQAIARDASLKHWVMGNAPEVTERATEGAVVLVKQR